MWAKRVERLADSGLTAKEFATEIGVNANTLAGWRWRLGCRGGGEPGKGQAQRSPKAVEVAAPEHVPEGGVPGAHPRRPRRASPTLAMEPIAPMEFVELTTEAPAVPAPVTTFEILLRSGRTVRVPGGFDAGELARLVGVLEGVRA